MGKNVTVPALIRKLIDSQHFGILASIMDSAPYSNLMAFVPRNNYHRLIFATSRDTRKYNNLIQTPQCSLFIDSRGNEAPAALEAQGVCACGRAFEIPPGRNRNSVIASYSKRHPALSAFIKSPNVTAFELQVDCYYFVENFQEVTEIHLN
ncbi:MAG: pyridoxamine 5'-phosphate oxidase family protein [Victivallales bacterium]|nr:pyridoxamine 5'-phosphate oxidase family protein [Victivallales bacterium]